MQDSSLSDGSMDCTPIHIKKEREEDTEKYRSVSSGTDTVSDDCGTRDHEESGGGTETLLTLDQGHSSSSTESLSSSNSEEFDTDDESEEGADCIRQSAVIRPGPHDVVISMWSDEYKQMLMPEFERLAKLREGDERPDPSTVAEEIIKCFRERIQKGNGRYLESNRSRVYREIDEKDARKKIIVDLRRESNKLFKKRTPESNEMSPTKKARLSSSVPCDYFGVRPKRGTQQLKDRNLPFKEKLPVTSNPIGNEVIAYEKNLTFDPDTVTTKKEKLVCAGQVFARHLIEKPQWIVQYCQVSAEQWDFVAYKDCNRCNSKMLHAKEGDTKFTGYEKLAKFLFQTGQDKTLIKNSKEIKTFLTTIGLLGKCVELMPPDVTAHASLSGKQSVQKSCQNPSSVLARTNILTQRTGHTIATSTDRLQESTDDKSFTNCSDFNSHSDFEALSTGFRRFRQVKKMVDEKLANVAKSFNSANHKWKHDASIEFYSGLKQWLYQRIRAESPIECFNADNILSFISEFESLMIDLIKAEENNDDMDVGINQNLIRALIDESKGRK